MLDVAWSPNAHSLLRHIEFTGRKLKFQLWVVCLKGSVDHKNYRSTEETGCLPGGVGRENVTEKVKLKEGFEILPFAATWMDLEGITLSETSQTDLMTLLICGI